MPGWRDAILSTLGAHLDGITLVADPDGLLVEETLLQTLHGQGAEVVPFEDSVSFRYLFEREFQPRLRRGESLRLLVVSPRDTWSLPYDLLRQGRSLHFGLGSLFPNLSYPIVAAIDRIWWDKLYDAQQRQLHRPLSDEATKDFILRTVFDIDPNRIHDPRELLRALLRVHYRSQRLPAVLEDHLRQRLATVPALRNWPLENLVPDRLAFLAFLQERWPVFLETLLPAGSKLVSEPRSAYFLKYPGPALLPFDDEDIRVYIDTLFLDGQLKPVPFSRAETVRNRWVSVGVAYDPAAHRQRRFSALLAAADEALPLPPDRYQSWLEFAPRFARVKALRWEPAIQTDQELVSKFDRLQSKIDANFRAWLTDKFAMLHNQPADPPVMPHHIPRFLARRVAGAAATRVALLVLDGMAYDQWVILRETLESESDLAFDEGALFAWVPTITEVSRQSLFAGKAPIYFPGTIFTTDREAASWTRFWEDAGLSRDQIAYARGLGEGSLEPVLQTVTDPRLQVLGLVVDTIDRIVHGMELGTAGMHNQVRQWAGKGYLRRLLDCLLANGFLVYLTADHGNVEARGCGAPQEGAAADHRGKRVRIYQSQLLRTDVQRRFPDAVAWQPTGLPGEYFPLLADDRKAFVPEGKTVVTHGGIAFEELVIPLVRVEGRGTWAQTPR